MKNYIRYISVASMMALTLFSCSKEERSGSGGPNIMFSMKEGLTGLSTKSVITDANLTSSTVKVYATMDNQTVTNMAPATLSLAASGFWKPTVAVQWADNPGAYSFTAYAYSNSGISDIDDDGLKFTVEEPVIYSDESAYADFVVGKPVTFTSAQAATYPLVEITMDHVLPCIEAYVTKAPSIATTTYISSMTLSGLYYSATLDYNEVSEKWIPTFIGERGGSYKLSGSEIEATTSRNTTGAKLRVVTVPQTLSQNTLLQVTYRVNESLDPGESSYKEYTESFPLADYVSELTSGHRTVFHLTIDTGLHLVASIAPWNHVDFIEGTVLPQIDYKDE